MQLRDNPQFLGRLLLMQQLFAGHPYGRSPFGDGSAIGKATVEELQAFAGRFLVPGRCALSVIGDFVLADMEKQVRDNWEPARKGRHRHGSHSARGASGKKCGAADGARFE